jgi:sugar phosphate isomerase/epimerase
VRPPLSLSHLTVLEVGPPDLITLAADAGFRSVGVRLVSPIPGGVEYPLRPGSPAMNETLQRMADLGVRVFDIEVVRLAPDTDVDAYEPVFEAGAALGAQRVCVNVDDPERTRTVDRFANLCDLAARYRLGVDIEFMIWRPIARLEDAAAVVAAAARPNGAILVDALHLTRSGGTAAAVARLDPRLLGSVQLCDAPAESPEPAEIINEARTARLPPGEGQLPLRQLMEALPEATPIAVEVPMTRTAPDLTPLERARRVFRAAEVFLREAPSDRPR